MISENTGRPGEQGYDATAMTTPIADFLERYATSHTERLHMPGHKGLATINGISVGRYDITEVYGADDLYHPTGIIRESESNASAVYGCPTFYATEGSSQCLKAMLYLALLRYKRCHPHCRTRPYIVAARNVHKAFVQAAALLDLDVVWLWPLQCQTGSNISCLITPEQVAEGLHTRLEPPIGVYCTTPDYLGGCLDLAAIAEVCHRYHTLLLVDGAHGAYFRFLNVKQYPDYRFAMTVADMCASSAHKTLPVLTGGAYLHLSSVLNDELAPLIKSALAMFGSSSPSYLTLASLDICNKIVSSPDWRQQLNAYCAQLDATKATLCSCGWRLYPSDPLRLTVQMPNNLTGEQMASKLRDAHLECEMADHNFMVLMLTPYNGDIFARLLEAFGRNNLPYDKAQEAKSAKVPFCHPKAQLSIRAALFSKEVLECAATPAQTDEQGVYRGFNPPCPPAIPEIMPGEVRIGYTRHR